MSIQSIIPITKAAKLSEHQTPGLTDGLGGPRNMLRFQPHEHLFFQGDTPKGVFQIMSGTVIVYKLMADGRRQIQDFASDGDILALTFAESHDLSAEALTQVEALFVPQPTFDRALQDQPSVRRYVFTLISDMLQATREQALLLGRKSAMERTATFLLFLDQRFANSIDGFVDLRMSRCDMADYLGLTFETVSRMMNRLKKLEIIDLPQPGRFKILSRHRLVATAGESDETHFSMTANH